MPFCLASSPSPSLPFSFLISIAEMAGGKQTYYCNSRGRFCSEEENALSTALAKRVRFHSEEESPLPPRSCLMAVKSVNGHQLLSSESSNGHQMVIGNRP
jgi:hypothetical protein